MCIKKVIVIDYYYLPELSGTLLLPDVRHLSQIASKHEACQSIGMHDVSVPYHIN